MGLSQKWVPGIPKSNVFFIINEEDQYGYIFSVSPYLRHTQIRHVKLNIHPTLDIHVRQRFPTAPTGSLFPVVNGSTQGTSNN